MYVCCVLMLIRFTVLFMFVTACDVCFILRGLFGDGDLLFLLFVCYLL